MFLYNIEDENLQTIYNKLEQCIISSIPKKETDVKNTRCILSEQSKNLIRERHDLQNKKPLSREDKHELTKLYKMTNKQIKLDYKNYRIQTIEKHLQISGSLKRAYHQKTWIPKLQKGFA